MNTKVLSVVTVLALAALACGFNISLPQMPTAGPEQTDQISVPAPASGETRLTLSFGAGDLSLSPGAQNLVEGTATYSNPDLKPDISTNGGNVEIKEGSLHSIPSPDGAKSTWDLKLGTTRVGMPISKARCVTSFRPGGMGPVISSTSKSGRLRK